MVMELVKSLGPWAWVILGLLLLVLEIVAPGTMFLWFGLAAVLVGLVAFVVDLGWQAEFILFAILSLVSVVVGRMILARSAGRPTDKPLLNERAKILVGQTFVLDEAIENGQGRIKVHDSYWRVQGPDCAIGSRVRVIDGEGTLLKVEPAD